jgi:23S rRNA (cytosine1962-C5)-methyltransferase
VESIYLKKHKEEAIAKGYPWIFADDITSLPLIESSEAGDLFKVCDHKGKFIATAYSDPESNIVARIIFNEPKDLGVGFFITKLNEALEKRRNIEGSYYRLCNSEGDYLPGLTVDRFDKIFSVKISTDGLFKYHKEIIEALNNIFSPQGILIRHKSGVIEIGQIPEEIIVIENEISYLCNLKGGQKTGWYFDQRENHKLVASLARGKSVLDVYCYNGGFGVAAAKEGASNVTFIDSSEMAMEYSQKNIRLNNCNVDCEFIQEDAFDALQRIKKKFDIVVLDPPPFMKSRKDKVAGIKGYKKLLEYSLSLIKDGGNLFFATCSHHMYMNDLIELVEQTSRSLSYKAEITKKLGAAADHPVHKLIPQTRYLNAVLVNLSKS